jgi:hypothetical protein
LIQKSFLFSWRNFNFSANQYQDLLLNWNKHLSTAWVFVTGYVLGGVGILGVIFGLVKRNRVVLATIPTLLLTLFFLFNINGPVGGIYSYLYNNFGIFSEGFRMPFTKFSILFELLMSLYFGYFVFLVATSNKIFRFFKVVILTFFIGALTYFALPVFRGELIGQNVRVALPSAYQDLFKWFNKEPDGRIALMPMLSKYGWEYRNWGYEGSGFLTYGIRQPILYRDFDRWNSGNEDFYNESAFAISIGDAKSFSSILTKYNVRYILLDESIIPAGEDTGPEKIRVTKDILSKIGAKEIAKFDFLSVYQTDSTTFTIDNIYSKSGNYINENPRNSVRNSYEISNKKPIVSENLSVNRGFDDAVNCDLNKIGIVSKQNSADGILYTANSGGVSCDFLDYPNLAYKEGLVLRISGENRKGRSLKIYLFNTKTKFAELEELMPEGKFDKTFLIQPKNIEGAGYTMSLETRSFGRIGSENLLSKVEFYPTTIPEPQVFNQPQGDLKVESIRKIGAFGYMVDIKDRGLIQLDQAYESGWVAFSDSGLLSHVKVNDWANGWVVNPGTNHAYIVYWPQILEWIGLIVYPIILTFSFKRDKMQPVS